MINKLNKNSQIYTLLALKPRIQDMYNYSYNENSKYYKELFHWNRIAFDVKESRWLMHFIE